MPFGAKTLQGFVDDVAKDPNCSEVDCTSNSSVKGKPAVFLENLLVPLKGHKGLKKMKLTDCDINDLAVDNLCAILTQNSSIEELILDKNLITGPGGEAIAKALQTNSSLKSINLKSQKVEISATTIEAFLVMLRDHNSTLLTIVWDADYNKVAPINKLLQRNAKIAKGQTDLMPTGSQGLAGGYSAPAEAAAAAPAPAAAAPAPAAAAAAAAPAAAAAGGGYTIVYHGAMKAFLGRGWVPMMILEEAGAKYDCKLPDAAPEHSFAPPMVISPSGAQVGQTAVISHMLGKELGLWPKDASDDIKAMQFCFDAADAFADAFAQKPPERLAQWFKHFEGQLEASGGPFLFGAKLTAVDYMVYPFAFVAQKTGADELGKCAKLTAWMSAIKDQKGFKAADALGIPILPPSS